MTDYVLLGSLHTSLMDVPFANTPLLFGDGPSEQPILFQSLGTILENAPAMYPTPLGSESCTMTKYKNQIHSFPCTTSCSPSRKESVAPLFKTNPWLVLSCSNDVRTPLRPPNESKYCSTNCLIWSEEASPAIAISSSSGLIYKNIRDIKSWPSHQ